MTDIGPGEAVDINDSGAVLFNHYSSNVRRASIWSNGTVNPLGFPPNAQATSINNSGHVIGFVNFSTNRYRGYIWNNRISAALGTLGGNSTTPYSLNDNGEVVGASTTSSGASHAFRWKNTEILDLGTINTGTPTWTAAMAINNSGLIAGISNGHVFTWREGEEMRDLGEYPRSADGRGGVWERVLLNNNGTVVATGQSGLHEHNTFIRSGETWLRVNDPNNPDPLTWTSNFAAKLNDLGQIAGFYSYSGGSLGYLYENGTTVYLGVVPTEFPVTGRDIFSMPTDMNNAGEVAGFSNHPGNRTAHGFVWKGGALTPLPPLPDTQHAHPVAINASGQVAGNSGGRVVVWTKTSQREYKK